MKDILQEVCSVSGVRGAFLCGPDGVLLVSAMPRGYENAALERVGRLGARAFAGLQAAGEVGDVDLSSSDGRLILKKVGKATLFILCVPQINLAFLNLSANVAVRNLQQELERKDVQRPQTAPPSKAEKLRAVITGVLGKQSARALDILATAGPAPADLLKAVDEIEKMTRLFISKKTADELGSRMRSIVADQSP